MDPSVSGPAVAHLGEDLFVLSIRPRDGKLLTRGRIDSALMASELVRLAAAGRAQLAGGRIAVRDRAPTGDAELDSALLSLIGAAVPPRPETWVGLPRPGIRDAYASRLIAAGVLRTESSRLLGTSRYQVIDPSRVAAARTRLDAVTQSSRPPDDLAQAALAGLASAIGLGAVLYPGREGRTRRARMAQIARQQVITRTAARTGAGDLVVPVGAVAGPRDPQAAGDLLRETAADAGGGPALPASMGEAIAAAVHAVTAVIEGGAAFGSQVLGAHDRGGRGPGAHSGDGHHDGAHGDGGGHWTVGGFGHH